jgi:hypothetical protein
MKSQHRIAILAALAVAAFALVPAALADKGGAKGGSPASTLNLVVLGASAAGSAQTVPQWGQQITFDVSTDAAYPSVEVDCYQGGAWVYQQIVGFYPMFADQTFTLKSFYWTSGAADCNATLYTTGKSGARQTLATTSFHVSA